MPEHGANSRASKTKVDQKAILQLGAGSRCASGAQGQYLAYSFDGHSWGKAPEDSNEYYTYPLHTRNPATIEDRGFTRGVCVYGGLLGIAQLRLQARGKKERWGIQAPLKRNRNPKDPRPARV